jgi:hypothetical protein
MERRRMHMDRWEYQNVQIRLQQFSAPQVKPYWDWVENLSDGSQIAGMAKILNRYGEKGWELIAIIPQCWEGNINTSVVVMSAVLKRQLQ